MSSRANKLAEMTAGRARARGRAVPAETQAVADASVADRKAADLDDPDTQWRILNPETMEYTLRLPAGERLIIIPLKYTWHDMRERRISEEIAVFATIFQTEVRTAKERFPEGNDAFTMALMRVREDARNLLAKVAYFVAEEGVKTDRPSVDEIAEGMELADTTAIAMRLIDARIQEVARLKNAQRAAPSL